MDSSINNRDKTHYDLLGVSRDSSLREIKTAFRRISLTTHPDRGGSDEAQARINHAYEILSDPARRRGYDAALRAGTAGISVKQRRSGRADEWEKSFRTGKGENNIKGRVREEVGRRSEELRSGFSRRVEAEYGSAWNDFRKTRGRFIISAAGAALFLASGFLHPFLWAGMAAAGYGLYRNARYGAGDDAVFILNPEGSSIVKRRARKKVTRETEALRARLEQSSETVDRLFAVLRRNTCLKDDEHTVLRRVLIHFFLLGYGPVSHDAENRIAVVTRGDDRIAVRYRHRTGAPANAAFITKLHDFMGEAGIRRGFLYSSPGLSKNAAKLSGKLGIVHYTTWELNAWIEGTPSGRYPGPEGDIIKELDSFMDFLS